ncbi:MAG: DoxX family protein [Chitinophagaceae bacterium]|uniref:DoxX family protein n=1 Tax=unclassified Paraflavitalea TaxID=2798305 RepID=UPI003D340DE1|nr:DoxX family protein [Chitinophagaceae bacterium]
MKNTKTWRAIGFTLKGLLVLFFLFDSVMKIMRHPESIKGSVALGISESLIQPIGIILLCFTIVFTIPKLSNIGALLLTAFLGGACSIMANANVAGHPYLFPIIICILMWVSQELISGKTMNLFLNKNVTAST